MRRFWLLKRELVWVLVIRSHPKSLHPRRDVPTTCHTGQIRTVGGMYL